MNKFILPRTLTLVRHGESEGNKIKQLQGDGDIRHKGLPSPDMHTLYFRLTEKGVEQAKQAGVWLKNYFHEESLRRSVTHGVCLRGFLSPYYRARETAGYLGLPIAWSIDHRISERNWGLLELMTQEERFEKFGYAVNHSNKHGIYWKIGGVESLQSLSVRLADHIRDLRDYQEEDVIQVSHGEAILVQRFLLENWLPEELTEIMQRTSLSEKSGPHTDWQNKMINCRIVQYTREKENGSWADNYVRVRMVNPADPANEKMNTGWINLSPRTFTNDELLRSIGGAPYLLR